MDKYILNKEKNLSAFPIAKAGMPFVLIAAFTTIILAIIGFNSLALFTLLITLFICFFFRDPDRLIPKKENTIVSPADGKIIFNDIVETNPYVEGRCIKISIFMSVFNVHINRIPFDGVVKKVQYFHGKFFNASFDKASKDNERNAITVEAKNGNTYCFVQIAGLIARRIICGIQEGDKAIKGERFGLICFGSRLDVYLPQDTDIVARVGDKVIAGKSILANFI